MEVFRKEHKGTVYRIYNDGTIYCPIYCIEYLVTYDYDGDKFECWKPAYEPKNILFTSLENAKNVLNALLDNI